MHTCEYTGSVWDGTVLPRCGVPATKSMTIYDVVVDGRRKPVVIGSKWLCDEHHAKKETDFDNLVDTCRS